jgi:pyrroline-5-carboxylate reductase
MKTLGFIGFGNMGRAIAAQSAASYRIFAFDKDPSKAADAANVTRCDSLAQVIAAAEMVVLAVKPQDIEQVLQEASSAVSADKLLVSIAAGITTAYIEKRLGTVRVVRVMPNMPAQIGAGMTCLCSGAFASEEDLDAAEDLFEFVGETERIEESMMNAVTAVSGSGPAYVCAALEQGNHSAETWPPQEHIRFVRDFEAAAQGAGIPAREAARLGRVTVEGTLRYLRQTRVAAQDLRRQVTSKGGTTEAALAVLAQGGSLAEAVKAAAARAAQLAKE